MKLGFIGLGKMGFNMVQRILNDGHQVVAWTRSGKTVQEIKEKGAIAASSIEELVSNLSGKKIVWMMVPSGKPVDDNLDLLLSLLKKDDIIIDGGNSYWKETQVRNKKAAEKGIHYIDCGTSISHNAFGMRLLHQGRLWYGVGKLQRKSGTVE